MQYLPWIITLTLALFLLAISIKFRGFVKKAVEDRILAADLITAAITDKWKWKHRYDELEATDVGEWMLKYKALEQGRDEQEENYEQQFLSFQEAIQTLETSRQYLIEYIEEHKEECPIFNPAPSQAGEDVYSSADMDNA